MVKFSFLHLLFGLGTIVILNSCNKKEKVCPSINCNSGIQNDQTCECDCPTGFSGTNCESFDPAKVQFLLDAGRTPKELYDEGIPLDSIYGKMYVGGSIFFLDTSDGTGMVAAAEDQDARAAWGCRGVDIVGLDNVTTCIEDCMPPEPEETAQGARIGDGQANTDEILSGCDESGIAAVICRGLGAEWFIPSRGELYLMYTNLHLQGYGGFTMGSVLYWTSTEGGYLDPKLFAWVQNFGDGSQGLGNKEIDTIYVRAARAF